MIFLENQKYIPKERKEYWCSYCDKNLVNSAIPCSGNLYLVYGHDIKEDSIFTGVIFAICSECLKKG